MGLSPPTLREILLVCLLLAGLYLVFIPETRPQFLPVPAPIISSAQRKPESLNDSVVVPPIYNTRLTWNSASQVPQTKIICHVPGRVAAACAYCAILIVFAGWSIIDQLYIFKGVVYIVSNDPHKIPDLSAIYSKGVDIEVGEEAEMARLPDDTDIRIISTTEARALFGTGAQILDGVTVRRLFLLF